MPKAIILQKKQVLVRARADRSRETLAYYLETCKKGDILFGYSEGYARWGTEAISKVVNSIAKRSAKNRGGE